MNNITFLSQVFVSNVELHQTRFGFTINQYLYTYIYIYVLIKKNREKKLLHLNKKFLICYKTKVLSFSDILSFNNKKVFLTKLYDGPLKKFKMQHLVLQLNTWSHCVSSTKFPFYPQFISSRLMVGWIQFRYF